MKKKLVISLLTIVAVVCLIFGISACEAPHEHSYGEWTVVTAPTCTKEGTEQRECDCSEEETRTIAALGHDLAEHAAQAPTCTEPGWSIYQTCTRCDYTTFEELAATGHNYESTVTTESTCTTDGVLTYTCTNCGDSYTEAITASGHDYESAVTAEATCTEEGVRTYTCANCGASYTETITATGHNYTSRITSQPGCTTTGLRTYTCINCGDRYTQTIAATGHDIEQHAAKAPNCMEVGWEAYETCTRCDYTTYEELPANDDHILINNAGVEEVLNEDKIFNYSEYDDVILIPDNVPYECGEYCYGIQECRICDAPFIFYVYIDPILVDHEGQDPTCTEPGWEAYQTCTRCDYTTYKEIPAKGHNYVDGVCTVCGKNETDESAE